jgi:hypothetical protein
MAAIFISHSSKDEPVAAELQRLLQQQGHRSIFLDFDPANGIPAGRDWERELYTQLRACQALIVRETARDGRRRVVREPFVRAVHVGVADSSTG